MGNRNIIPSLESITKVPDRLVYLLSSLSLSHISKITVEAVTIQTKSLGTALTIYSTQTILLLKYSDVILSAIRHFVRTLFIVCTPPTGSSTEHVFT